jgi:uncharacterized tellurite resistance protein B-like protein
VDQSLNHQVCQLIAGIVVADDDLDPQESAFIDRMLVRFGIPLEDRDIIFPIVDKDEAVEKMQQLPADVQEQTLELLVEAATADGKVVPEERAYLDAVAAAVGKDKAALDDLIAQFLK